MPSLPAWTALPATLDLLLGRMLDVSQYPVVSQGRARCETVLVADNAPDPHDWQLWRTGTFLAQYDGQFQRWPVYLRRCSACKSVEVRRDGMGGNIHSRTKPIRDVIRKRTPGAADELLGWYQGE